METSGSISAAEASSALASARQSRARVAWAGYPTWYWFATAAVLALLPFATVLPDLFGIGLTAVAAVAAIWLAVAAGRVRGVCEGWTSTAMRWQEIVLLYGPSIVVLFAGAVVSRFAWWAPIAAAVLTFVLFAGTGLVLSARAARR
jgi:hypothetical protein